MNNCFSFGSKVTAKADIALNNETAKKLWKSFCCGCSEIELLEGESNTLLLGEAEIPKLPDGKEYAISVTEKGIAIVGNSYDSLIKGFFVLLMKIEYVSLKKGEEYFKISNCFEESNYDIKNRMIHICVFPENDFYYIKKLMRLSAVCQYTHIVIEFWGMLKYDCLKELAWSHAFTKEQVRELIAEAKELGIKLIPMFNMFGHASASRLHQGKHVVLDQNPRLQYLFTPDGWAWDIRSDDVYELLKQIRIELYDLFGDTEYFHIGCDEAYYYIKCDELRSYLPEFLGRLTNDVVSEGYRPMLWMDMIIERSKFPEKYFAFGIDGEADILLKSLAPETVMVDWQYCVKEPPVETALYLSKKDSDKDLIIAPWYDERNYDACIKTIKENDMFGIMLTTWHTLKDYMPSILSCAIKCGAKTFPWSDAKAEMQKSETATLLRRISFEGNDYFDSGWAKKQIII